MRSGPFLYSATASPFQLPEARNLTCTNLLSPDGKWLAYISPESGQYEVYVVPFIHGSGKWLFSGAGGHFPRWRHDGKELFYLSLDNKIMSGEIADQARALWWAG